MAYTLDQLKKRWGKDKDARAYAARKRSMYANVWKDWLNEEMRKLFEDDTFNSLKQRSDTSVNVFRWTIDELAAIYSRPVTRYIGDVELSLSPEVDMAMDLACKWTYGTGEVLLRPTWVNGRMLVWAYPRERWYAVPSSVDPLSLDVVIVEHVDGDRTSYEVWTAEERLRLDANWQVVKGEDAVAPNQYGVVPYVVAHSEYPSASFYHGDAADDLAQACLDLGIGLTDFGHIKHFQSYKQGAVRADSLKDSDLARFKSDPASWLSLKGANAHAWAIDMQADLQGHLNVCLDKSQFTVGLRGARPTLVRGEESAASGYALLIKEWKKTAVWQQLQQLWMLWETQLWAVARQVVPKEGGPAIPEGDLWIAWPQLGPGSSKLETAQYVSTVAAVLGEEESLRELGYSDDDIQRIIRQKVEESVRNPMISPMLLPRFSAGGE